MNKYNSNTAKYLQMYISLFLIQILKLKRLSVITYSWRGQKRGKINYSWARGKYMSSKAAKKFKTIEENANLVTVHIEMIYVQNIHTAHNMINHHNNEMPLTP